MIGMAYKDFCVLRKQASYYLAFLVVYAVLAVAGVFPASVLGGLVVLIGMMLPMSSFAYDDQARWDKYASATPAGRAGVVGGKYLFAVAATLAAAVLAAAAYLALILTGSAEESIPEMIAINCACVAVVLVVDAVILPLLFKFGAEKSRMISMILFVAVFGAVMGLNILAEKGISPAPPPGWLLAALPGVLGLLAVGGYAVSYFISRAIYEKKEL